MTLVFEQPELWPTCPLANCPNPTSEPGQPCDECLDLFGDHLRPTGRPVPDDFEEKMRQADEKVRLILTQRREFEPLPVNPPPSIEPEWKMNQRCWVCDERRKCCHDPNFTVGEPRWICRECKEPEGKP